MAKKPLPPELREALSKLRRIQIGNTLEVFSPACASEVYDRAQRAIRRGVEVVWEDGTREFVTSSPAIRPDQTGSAVYIWNPDGDRVLWNHTLHRITPDGGRHETPLPNTWRKP